MWARCRRLAAPRELISHHNWVQHLAQTPLLGTLFPPCPAVPDPCGRALCTTSCPCPFTHGLTLSFFPHTLCCSPSSLSTSPGTTSPATSSDQTRPTQTDTQRGSCEAAGGLLARVAAAVKGCCWWFWWRRQAERKKPPPHQKPFCSAGCASIPTSSVTDQHSPPPLPAGLPCPRCPAHAAPRLPAGPTPSSGRCWTSCSTRQTTSRQSSATTSGTHACCCRRCCWVAACCLVW